MTIIESPLHCVELLPSELRDLDQSWEYFRHSDLHKVAAVDATSLTVMKRAQIRIALNLDHRLSVAGFRFVSQPTLQTIR